MRFESSKVGCTRSFWLFLKNPATRHFWKNEKNRMQIVRIALIPTDFLKFFCENPYNLRHIRVHPFKTVR